MPATCLSQDNAEFEGASVRRCELGHVYWIAFLVSSTRLRTLCGGVQVAAFSRAFETGLYSKSSAQDAWVLRCQLNAGRSTSQAWVCMSARQLVEVLDCSRARTLDNLRNAAAAGNPKARSIKALLHSLLHGVKARPRHSSARSFMFRSSRVAAEDDTAAFTTHDGLSVSEARLSQDFQQQELTPAASPHQLSTAAQGSALHVSHQSDSGSESGPKALLQGEGQPAAASECELSSHGPSYQPSPPAQRQLRLPPLPGAFRGGAPGLLVEGKVRAATESLQLSLPPLAQAHLRRRNIVALGGPWVEDRRLEVADAEAGELQHLAMSIMTTLLKVDPPSGSGSTHSGESSAHGQLWDDGVGATRCLGVEGARTAEGSTAVPSETEPRAECSAQGRSAESVSIVAESAVTVEVAEQSGLRSRPWRRARDLVLPQAAPASKGTQLLQFFRQAGADPVLRAQAPFLSSLAKVCVGTFSCLFLQPVRIALGRDWES